MNFTKNSSDSDVAYSLEYAYREEEKPVMTVNDVSKLTGVSIRTLQYYMIRLDF